MQQWTHIKERVAVWSTQELQISIEGRHQSNLQTPNSIASQKTSSPLTALWPPKLVAQMLVNYQLQMRRKLIRRHNRCTMRSSSMRTVAWTRRCWEAWTSLDLYHPAHSITLSFRRLDWARYERVCIGRIRQNHIQPSRLRILLQLLSHVSLIYSHPSLWHRAF